MNHQLKTVIVALLSHGILLTSVATAVQNETNSGAGLGGEPVFHSEAYLNDLLVANKGFVAADATSPELVFILRSMLDGQEKNSAEGGCFTIVDSFDHTVTEFIDLERFEAGYPMALEDLVERADVVIHGKVLEESSGSIGLVLGTKYLLKVLQIQNHTELPLLPKVHFFSKIFQLTLGGQRLCREKPGFFKPAVGDEVFLLGKLLQGQPSYVVSVNLFPVQGGEIQPQPYYFLREEVPTPLPLAFSWAGVER